MSIFTGIIVFLLVYWTVLFAVLPWGVKPPEKVEDGHATGAPSDPRLLKKFGITFILSIIIWALIAFLMKIDIIDFHSISQDMIREDHLNKGL